MTTRDDEGFLSRWSRRKAEVRDGASAQPPATESVAPAPSLPAPASPPATEPVAAPPPPTLDDVAALTRDADFSRFVAADVDAGVKNAALKKLFGDPHFNVMDGLDIYIDDYTREDPIPAGMLAQLEHARVTLFVEEENAPDAGTPPEPSASNAPVPPGDNETSPS